MKKFVMCMGVLGLLAGCGQNKKEFTVTSSSFKEGELFLEPFTCDGAGISPQLSWSGAPRGTQSFAVIMQDITLEKPFIHWVVFDLPATVTSLDQAIGVNTIGGVVGTNSAQKAEYFGACPPKGDEPHTYVFTVYALDNKLNLGADATADQVTDALQGHVLAQATISANYFRK